MPRKRVYTDYLNDMLQYATYAEQFVTNMSYEQFESDIKTQLAVIQAIATIGEAANRIPDSLQS